ncbi:10034_t:CDS:10 [Ambispora leptoticha]|uniref:10034_t:CDS:1 n=1 Tax=Ambispora leptoticha TaxID=144679 RepID=A0A9N8Z983_9GLOM|nr:10034_t:CDS:10 [Ambispora leptoticha]
MDSSFISRDTIMLSTSCFKKPIIDDSVSSTNTTIDSSVNKRNVAVESTSKDNAAHGLEQNLKLSNDEFLSNVSAKELKLRDNLLDYNASTSILLARLAAKETASDQNSLSETSKSDLSTGLISYNNLPSINKSIAQNLITSASPDHNSNLSVTTSNVNTMILDILTPPTSPNGLTADLNQTEMPQCNKSRHTLDDDTLRKLAHHFLSPKEERSKDDTLYVAQESTNVFYFQPDSHTDKMSEQNKGGLPRLPFETIRKQSSIFSSNSKFGNSWGGIPSRWLLIANLPKDIDVPTLIELVQAQGEVNEIFIRFLRTHGFIYSVFYDIRDAIKARRQLRSHSINGKHLNVEFCARPFSKNSSQSDNPKPSKWDNEGILMLEVLGKRFDESTIKAELDFHGNIRSMTPLESTDSQKILVEYYDTRDALGAKELLNGKIIKNATVKVDYYNYDPLSWQMAINVFQQKKEQAEYIQKTLENFYLSSPSVERSPYAQLGNSMFAQRRFQPHGFAFESSHGSNSFRSGSSYNSYGSFMTGAEDLFETAQNVTMQKKGVQKLKQTGPNNSTVIVSGDRKIPPQNKFDSKKIANGEDPRTTFMIRNIPNKYTQRMLMDTLDETHKGQYDFLYLRMDFKNRCNVGYAFINFIDANAVLSFADVRVGKRWACFNSEKVCELAYANIQGKKALVEKFRNSSVMDELPEYRPKVFYSSGILRGQEQPFPSPNDPQKKKRSLAARGAVKSSCSTV